MKHFLRDLSALVFTRAVILGPIERMKIIMQVKHLAQFVNPADRPKNLLDLSNSKSVFFITILRDRCESRTDGLLQRHKCFSVQNGIYTTY
jgi:hypothetical protein